jgi:hypothetical protein
MTGGEQHILDFRHEHCLHQRRHGGNVFTFESDRFNLKLHMVGFIERLVISVIRSELPVLLDGGTIFPKNLSLIWFSRVSF